MLGVASPAIGSAAQVGSFPAQIGGVDLVGVAVNWLMLSALYALVAVGFTLIFGVGGVLNLAHGANITVGAYTAYFVTLTGLGIWTGSVAAVLVTGAFSIALYLTLIRPVEESPITVMILTLVTALVVEQVIVVLPNAGAQPKAVSNLVSGQLAFGPTGVQYNRIVVFLLSWVVILGLFAFIERTDTGRAIRAASQSERGAALVGIDSHRVSLYTWGLAGALAGIAGVFLASQRVATPFMGRSPLLLSFAIVVVGGIGSVKGSIAGAYLVGFLDVVTVSLVSTRLTGLMPLVALVVVLLVKPEGLFGRELAEG